MDAADSVTLLYHCRNLVNEPDVILLPSKSIKGSFMHLPRRTVIRVAWLSVLSVVGITRSSLALSSESPRVEELAEANPGPSEPNPLEPDSAGSSPTSTNSAQEASTAPAAPVLPPTAAFPVEPERAPVTAPTKTIKSDRPAPTPMPAKAPVQSDAPFDPSSRKSATDSPSSNHPASEPPEQTSPEESSSRVIRLGPMVGVGLPGLISIGGMLKLTSYLGFGVNMGFIPSMHISYYGEATLAYQEYDAYARVFPFGGGFFLGAGVGYATIKGTMKSKFDTTAYQAEAALAGIAVPNPLTYQSEGSVKTMIVAPQIGYFYTTDIGFSIGLDVGAQVPIAPSQVTYKSHLTLPAGTPSAVVSGIQSQYVAPNDKKVRDTLDTIGRSPYPTFNIKIGWLF